MNLVDSCGWLEYVADGANARHFAPAIEDVSNLLVPTLCLLEVFKSVLRQRGEGPALQLAALMHQGTVVDLDSSLALGAAKLGLEYRLPLADSIVLSTARVYDATLWTQDAHFKRIRGIRYVSQRGRKR